ncbi:MAG: helix-hairpin-helix domain-containing protein [Candidatus Onthomorpha sp.]|nr:helix-hairpin-helix domain-containing protein [Candidatus Onthomorpha sp.]
MELKRLCSRHLSLILFFVGIAVGLSAVFFVLKDNIHIVSEAKPKSDAQTTNRKAPKTQPSSHFASSKYHFRPFNPNSVSRKELLSFGLSEKQADNILNYRTKAGGFKNKEQFARLYCMQGGLFEQISPYLVFENQIAKSETTSENTLSETQTPHTAAAKPETHKLVLDLNLCDSLDLQQIKGIGQKRASMIYRYGKKLGGYVSVEQLKEVYGIDESLFESIKSHFVVSDCPIRKVNINSDQIKTLVAHPYIDIQLAKALIQFRKDYNRNFQKPEEIRQIHFLSEQEFQKLLPYITTSN